MTGTLSSPKMRGERTTLTAAGAYSLDTSRRFFDGPLPIASRLGDTRDHVHFAFVPDGQPVGAVGVCVQSAAGGVSVELTTADLTDVDRVISQVARILSLDVDATGYDSLAAADPVVGAMQQQYPGLRPVTFLSPYEAGAWFLIGNRIRMSQAAAVKQRLSVELGEPVTICGERHHAFPGPGVVSQLGPVKGLSPRKVEYLRALAVAALDSDLLDGQTLRDADPAAAVARLRELPGVGPFTADGILIRGAGTPDVLTLNESRLATAVQLAYALDTPPDPDTLTVMSDKWRPFRSWVIVLLRVALADAASALDKEGSPQ